MKKYLILLLAIGLLAAGCAVASDDRFMSERISSVDGFNKVYRFTDTDNNVVCYYLANGISCVKK